MSEEADAQQGVRGAPVGGKPSDDTPQETTTENAVSVDAAEDAAQAESAALPVRPGYPRRLVAALATVTALLLVLAVVLGFGWARANGDLAEERRAHAAARNQLSAELETVAARRTQLERDLAAAQAQALDPQSRTAIEACVREYAEYERVLTDLVKNGSWQALDGQQSVIIARYTRDFTPYISTACRDAEPHLTR